MKLVNVIRTDDMVFQVWRDAKGNRFVSRTFRDLTKAVACEKLRRQGFPEKYLEPIERGTLRSTVLLKGEEVPIEAFEIARKWAKEKFPLSLLLLGSVGTGKTQAVVTAAWWLLKKRKIATARFYSAMELRAAFDKGELQKDIKEVDLLVIDDLGREYRSDYNAYIVEAVITTRYDLQKPVCITANITFEEIANRYTPRVLDRLREWAYRRIVKQTFSLRGLSGGK
ncbi:ATP-binding protein [Desulfurobacterium sp.]